MVMGIADSAGIWDILHNLDLSNQKHVEIYEALAFRFIAVNEVYSKPDKKTGDYKIEPDLEAYLDTEGNTTIGYGFNMNAHRKEWDETIDATPTFDDACSGKVKITKQ